METLTDYYGRPLAVMLRCDLLELLDQIEAAALDDDPFTVIDRVRDIRDAMREQS